MGNQEIKKSLMRLWKDTFHDSDEYISLVFDNYFNPDFVEYHSEGGVPVAGLLAVPYEFGNADNKIRGAYLCGLATRPEYRNQGIMGAMIDRICLRLKEQKFAFVFLIPANSGLRKFYYDRKFVNAFYRNCVRYVSNHKFTKEYCSIIEKEDSRLLKNKIDLYDDLLVMNISESELNYTDIYNNNISIIDKIISYILGKESSQFGIKIFQNFKNLEIVIKENIISKGKIYYCKSIDNLINGVAFAVLDKDVIILSQIYADNIAVFYKILDCIKTDYPDKGIKIFMPSYNVKRNAIWSRYFENIMESAHQVPEISDMENSYRPSENVEIYGLARIIDFSEILKFIADYRRDLKFSILMKEEKSGKIINFRSKNGILEKRILEPGDYSPAEVMTEMELAALIFRKPSDDASLITDVMGITPAEGWISLMLD